MGLSIFFPFETRFQHVVLAVLDGTRSIDQAFMELMKSVCLSLPSAEIKGARHYFQQGSKCPHSPPHVNPLLKPRSQVMSLLAVTQGSERLHRVFPSPISLQNREEAHCIM